jgi:chromosome segregation ATPase
VWQCNKKYSEKLHCQTPHLTEDMLQRTFVKAFNLLQGKKEQLAPELVELMRSLGDTSKLDTEIATLQAALAEILAQLEALLKDNARTARDQEEYARQYDKLTARYQTKKARLDALTAKKQSMAIRRKKIRRFCEILNKTAAPLEAFDARLWCATVETVTVYSMKKVALRFSGGTTIEVALDR